MKFRPYSKKLDYSYSIGVFSTIELLKYKSENVIKVLLSSQGATNEGITKIKELCSEKGIFLENSDNLVRKLSQSENNYAIGIFRKYQTAIDPSKSHVLLVNPSDMGNIGTIIRTLIGFGHSELGIIRPAADTFDPKVIRASMGAIFQSNIEYFDSFEKYHEKFHQHSLYPFMTKYSVDIKQVEFTSPYSLIFGNEGEGLSEDFADKGTAVKIPQTDKVDSLNLAVSVGIGLYEANNKHTDQS